ncbi:MAG: ABC transporter permease [Alistipes sp.]|nr:ABC transporter permease [Alistipes sp.]
MNLEYFIARGMSRSASGRRSIMVRIAIGSAALGVAVMIVAVAVIAGFSREIERRMTGFMGHVRVTSSMSASGSEEPAMFARDAYAEERLRAAGDVVSIDPYAVRSGVVKTDESVEGLLLKGYDGDGAAIYASSLVEGAMPRQGDSVRYKDILLSKTAAARLDVHTGDRIEMLFFDGGRSPRRDLFTVSGIYSTGMDEAERMIAITDIRNVRRLASGGDNDVSGYEIRLADGSAADSYAARADSMLFLDEGVSVGLRAESLHDIYPAIFDWMKTNDVNGSVVITLMLLVSLFNMAAARFVMVLERTRSIGVLKALGMSNGSLRKVFLLRALFITLEGVLWGDAAGVALCMAQKWWHVIKLDPEGYMLSYMPVHLEWWHVVLIDAGAAAVILLGLLLPSRIVSSVKPADAVRYE